jgi:hypothetical protein
MSATPATAQLPAATGADGAYGRPRDALRGRVTADGSGDRPAGPVERHHHATHDRLDPSRVVPAGRPVDGPAPRDRARPAWRPA